MAGVETVLLLLGLGWLAAAFPVGGVSRDAIVRVVRTGVRGVVAVGVCSRRLSKFGRFGGSNGPEILLLNYWSCRTDVRQVLLNT
jgi:hypothetical protein